MDGAEVIGQTRKMSAPPVPIEIGKTFTLENTSYFVMGRVMYEGWDDEDRWKWNEWMLGSSDGRLLWLSYDENGFTLFKKMRMKEPFNAQSGDAIPIGNGRNVRVHERYPAKIIGAEGELTWRASTDERLYMVEGAGHGKRYSVQQTAEELEIHEGDPVAQEAIAQAFQDEAWLKRIKQQLAGRGLWRNVGIACIFFALLGLVGVGLTNSMGENMTTQTITLSRANPIAQIPIEFNQANRPARIRVNAETSLPENTAADVEAGIVSPDGTENYLFTLELWHETGSDDEGFWREVRDSANNMFVPKQAGAHTLELELGESQLDSMSVEINVRRNVMSSTWLLIYTGVIGVVGIILIFVNSKGSR